MRQTILELIYADFKEKKQFTLPAHLLPAGQGFNLLRWLEELLLYYDTAGFVVRPFDELPPLRLSGQACLPITVQDIHRFVINDLNLVPPRVRRMLLAQSVAHGSAAEAWQHLLPLLTDMLLPLPEDSIIDEVTWKFSPIAELLTALTWVFMEREQVAPPKGTRLACARFPYYQWTTEDGSMSLWEPEQPLCRWERLAFELYTAWQQRQK